MKISYNLKQDSFSEKNNTKTVEIGNKTNERKQCQKQNIFNNKLERTDQKANTNTSAEMKLFYNLKQDTSSEKNSSQTVEMRNKRNERKQCQKQNIFNNKLERSDQKSNTNTSGEMKISQNVKKDMCSKGNSWKTVDIEKKTNKEKECQKQNISRNKLE